MIFYLHGMGGSPADWRETAALLPGEALPLPEDFVDPLSAARALEVALPPTGFSLCGYSLGGRLALLACAERLRRGGALPRKLALVSTGFGFADAEERAQRLTADQAWARLAAENPDGFWEKWYAQPLFASLALLPEARKATWLAQRNALDSKHLVAQLEKLSPALHDDLLPLLGLMCHAGVSVLYIAGELDKKYVSLCERARAQGVETAVLKRAGHALPLEAPAPLAKCLQEFFGGR